MLRSIKGLIASFLLMVALAAPGLTLAPAGAQSIRDCTGEGGNISKCLNAGTCETNKNAEGNCPNAEGADKRVSNIIRTVINIISLIVGVIAVIMIIIGGLKYITSSGDAGNVSSAKNTILYAIVGLIIVALAQIIVRFILNRVT